MAYPFLSRGPLFSLLAAAMCLLGGCGILGRSIGPEPTVMSDEQRARLVDMADEAATNAAYGETGADEDKRRLVRDNYILNRLAILDVRFLEYIHSLGASRRLIDSATESTVIGLSVIGTVVDTARAKENLAALVAAITGTKASVDKNYFENRGLNAIVSTMIARRKEILARVVSSMQSPTAAYSLVSARNDLNDYYLAGTMDGAFVAIQESANKRDEAATRSIQNVELVRNTVDNINADTLQIKRGLTQALAGPKATPESIRKALELLDVPPDRVPASTDDSKQLLKQFIQGARSKDKIDAMKNIFTSAGLL
jgi:hypothetical protein